MPAPLSIIIPTLNSAHALPHCVDALLEGLSRHLVRELIISDGGSDDNVDEIADSLGARLVQSAPGRGHQLARGAKHARGEWLLFLHSDSIPDPGWSDHVLRHINAFHGRAGCFRLRFDDRGLFPTWYAGWANIRSGWFSLPYGDQGMLVHRDLYEHIGGYPDIPLMEDVALARKLRGMIRVLNCHVTTGTDSYLRRGWLAGGCQNIFLLLMYFLGISPGVLARWYSVGQGRDRH